MARTDLTIQQLPDPYATSGQTVTFEAADATNGNQFESTGNEILVARNTDTASHTVTVTSTPDEKSRTGDIDADSIATDEVRVYQEFPTQGWKNTADGQIYVDADDTTVEFAVLRTR